MVLKGQAVSEYFDNTRHDLVTMYDGISINIAFL